MSLPAYPLPRDDFQLQPIDPVEEHFRHSGWQVDRKRTFEAMLACHVSANRLDAFANCGTHCVVQYSASRQKYRLCASYCHDRFCAPCAAAKAAKMSRRFQKAAGGKQLRFVTLTLKHNKNALKDQISRLIACFNLLRRRTVWKNAVTGGASFVEVKLSKFDGCWHPHMHILVEGNFIAQKELALAWYACTGDSYVVDIRSLSCLEEVIGYVTKYAGKPVGGVVLQSPERLQEAITTMRGRRFCTTFGNWHNVSHDDDDGGLEDWGTISSLAGLLAASATGNNLAVRIYTAVFHHPPEEKNARDPTLATAYDEEARIASEKKQLDAEVDLISWQLQTPVRDVGK